MFPAKPRYLYPITASTDLAIRRILARQSLPSQSFPTIAEPHSYAEAHPHASPYQWPGHELELEPRVTLLDALRDHLALNGTKKGCDQGQCGACTVHIDGVRVLACLTLAAQVEGRAITTIEGLASPAAICIPCRRPSWSRTPSSAAIARPGRSCPPSPASAKAMPDRTRRSVNTCRAISAAAAPIRIS